MLYMCCDAPFKMLNAVMFHICAALYLVRDDTFIHKLSEDMQSSFIQASSASRKICGHHDKIKYKFPVGFICLL